MLVETVNFGSQWRCMTTCPGWRPMRDFCLRICQMALTMAWLWRTWMWTPWCTDTSTQRTPPPTLSNLGQTLEYDQAHSDSGSLLSETGGQVLLQVYFWHLDVQPSPYLTTLPFPQEREWERDRQTEGVWGGGGVEAKSYMLTWCTYVTQ